MLPWTKSPTMQSFSANECNLLQITDVTGRVFACAWEWSTESRDLAPAWFDRWDIAAVVWAYWAWQSRWAWQSPPLPAGNLGSSSRGRISAASAADRWIAAVAALPIAAPAMMARRAPWCEENLQISNLDHLGSLLLLVSCSLSPLCIICVAFVILLVVIGLKVHV